MTGWKQAYHLSYRTTLLIELDIPDDVRLRHIKRYLLSIRQRKFTGGRPVLRNVDWNKATVSASVNPKTVKILNRKHGSILYQTFNN